MKMNKKYVFRQGCALKNINENEQKKNNDFRKGCLKTIGFNKGGVHMKINENQRKSLISARGYTDENQPKSTKIHDVGKRVPL